MYKKHNDTWMVELLFDDLYDWNTWYECDIDDSSTSVFSVNSRTLMECSTDPSQYGRSHTDESY